LSDLGHIQTDGTYEIGENPAKVERDRVDQLRRAFARGTTDDYGDELDLRPTMDDVRKAGVSYPKEFRDKPLPGVPKYDPDTGELINPLGVDGSAPPDPSTIPVANRVITYAPVSGERALRLRSLPLAMFQPINVFVMVCILIMHGFMQMSMLIVTFGGFLNIPVLFVCFCLLIAHYATVIDETGPEHRDELPRPLRHCDWLDDLWGPFSRAVGAFILSFFPAILILTSTSLPW